MTLEIITEKPAPLAKTYRIQQFIKELAEQPKGTLAVSHRWEGFKRQNCVNASSVANRMNLRYPELEWFTGKDENGYFVYARFPAE